MDTFGKRLKQAIKDAGLTQTQLAEEMGRSKGAVSQWVNDETEPDLTTVAKIAAKLKVSADALVRGVDTRFMDPSTVEIAERIQSLDEESRRGVYQLIFGRRATDETVEERMPVTKTLKRPGRNK